MTIHRKHSTLSRRKAPAGAVSREGPGLNEGRQRLNLPTAQVRRVTMEMVSYISRPFGSYSTPNPVHHTPARQGELASFIPEGRDRPGDANCSCSAFPFLPSGRWGFRANRRTPAANSVPAWKGRVGKVASTRGPSRRCRRDQRGIRKSRCSQWGQDQVSDQTPTCPKGGGTLKAPSELRHSPGEVVRDPRVKSFDFCPSAGWDTKEESGCFVEK